MGEFGCYYCARSSVVLSRFVRHVVQLDDQKSVVSKRGVYEYKGSKRESVCLGVRKRSGTDSGREERALA
jgi:hypothetical protein